MLGSARVVAPGEEAITETSIPAARVPDELALLEQAVSATMAEIGSLRAVAVKKMGGPLARIFDAQLMVAGDVEFLNQVKRQISEKKQSAAFAYSTQVHKATTPLKESPDLYLQQTAQDIEAVANKVLQHMHGTVAQQEGSLAPNTILIGHQFSAAEILLYRDKKAIGFVPSEGGRNSHMALIARSLMLPVVLVEKLWQQVADESRLIVDGTKGLVIVNPTESEWREYQKLRKKFGPAIYARLRKLDGQTPVTADGKNIIVAANLELPGPVDEVVAELALPVGLYRTEFLCLQQGDFPDEETQFEQYEAIAETFARSMVVLRTFDLGSDKLPVGKLETAESNPALGWRGIRCMLDMPAIFRTQLRAILRASHRKNLRILLPMISDLSELERTKKLIAQLMFELKKSRQPFDPAIKIGIMVEVPSAALTIEQFLPHVDFVSVGTNDLTQYTLAADRNNGLVNDLYNSAHPAVFSLVKMVADGCLRHRTPLTLCGEAAGDPLLLPAFLGMGITEYSMNPTKIFDVWRLIRKIRADMVRALVPSLLTSGTAQSAVRKLTSFRNALDKR